MTISNIIKRRGRWDTTCNGLNKTNFVNLKHNASFFNAGSFSFTSHLRYVICSYANAPVFKNHGSLPSKSFRKRLLEVVWYMVWVFSKNSVAVMECCRQDIVGKRERRAFFDYKVHTLFSPKTQTKKQR